MLNRSFNWFVKFHYDINNRICDPSWPRPLDETLSHTRAKGAHAHTQRKGKDEKTCATREIQSLDQYFMSMSTSISPNRSWQQSTYLFSILLSRIVKGFSGNPISCKRMGDVCLSDCVVAVAPASVSSRSFSVRVRSFVPRPSGSRPLFFSPSPSFYIKMKENIHLPLFILVVIAVRETASACA